MAGLNFQPDDAEIINLAEKFCARIMQNIKRGLANPDLEDKVTDVFNSLNDTYMLSNILDTGDSNDVNNVFATLTSEKLEEMAAVAAAFDESGDDILKRQASVLDEILHTLASPKDYIFNFKKAEDEKLEELKKKYKNVKEELDENIGVKEALDAIKESPVNKTYRPLEAPLSTRTCIDHPGAQLSRIGDNTWQCSLDHKVYNFETGFNTLHGDKVPGGSVSEQTPKYFQDGHQMFDSRDGRLGLFRE